jgi:hypothetical protein
MTTKSLNKSLQAAKSAKKDEFYTQLSDTKRNSNTTKTISKARLFSATATIRG